MCRSRTESKTPDAMRHLVRDRWKMLAIGAAAANRPRPQRPPRSPHEPSGHAFCVPEDKLREMRGPGCRFRLRAPRVGGLEPEIAREASEGGSLTRATTLV